MWNNLPSTLPLSTETPMVPIDQQQTTWAIEWNGSTSTLFPTTPVVPIDPQVIGVELVHALMACGNALQQENLELAVTLVDHIVLLASFPIGVMRKVANYFAKAIIRRINGVDPDETMHSCFSDEYYSSFYRFSPYLKLAHFIANQAILKAFSTAARVHVIDFNLEQGMQWETLMNELALRPGGPPTFRLTGIGPTKVDIETFEKVGDRLAMIAQRIGVQFEFREFPCESLADIGPNLLEIKHDEVVAVNSMFKLHSMLGQPGSVDKILDAIKKINPEIVTVVEQETNHNDPIFVDRFNEALHYYSSFFDSLEEGSPSHDVWSEHYLGRQIYNVVAFEGVDRVERHETLSQWRSRMVSAGFEPVHLGLNLLNQSSSWLALSAGDGHGYRVEENDGCLILGWHMRALIATSAWKLPPNDLTQSTF